MTDAKELVAPESVSDVRDAGEARGGSSEGGDRDAKPVQSVLVAGRSGGDTQSVATEANPASRHPSDLTSRTAAIRFGQRVRRPLLKADVLDCSFCKRYNRDRAPRKAAYLTICWYGKATRIGYGTMYACEQHSAGMPDYDAAREEWLRNDWLAASEGPSGLIPAEAAVRNSPDPSTPPAVAGKERQP